MTITLPSNARGPILDLTLPAALDAVSIALRNKTTGESMTVNLPANWDGSDLSLDFYRRTIRDASGMDRSALLDPVDNGLWTPGPLAAGANSVTIEALRAITSDFIVGSEAGTITDVATTATHVYFNLGGPFSEYIGRAKLDGTEVNLAFIKAGVGVSALALDGTYIYWGAGAIGRAKLDGTEVNTSFISGATVAEALAVNGTHIFWVQANKIGRAKIDGSEVNTSYIAAEAGRRRLALDGTYIYWTNPTTDAIGRVKLDGSSSTAKFIGECLDPIGITTDGTYLYWTNQAGSSIGRAKVAGTEVNQAFVTGLRTPSGLTTRAGLFYWATSNGVRYTVGRTGKTPFPATARLHWEKGYA